MRTQYVFAPICCSARNTSILCQGMVSFNCDASDAEFESHPLAAPHLRHTKGTVKRSNGGLAHVVEPQNLVLGEHHGIPRKNRGGSTLDVVESVERAQRYIKRSSLLLLKDSSPILFLVPLFSFFSSSYTSLLLSNALLFRHALHEIHLSAGCGPCLFLCCCFSCRLGGKR